jgi:structural maintenance of chromosomes protein 5
LKQLDDVSHRKLQNLAQHDPDCAAVINWLRANKHRFHMEIIEPAVVSLTVPNKNYVHAVEACFSTVQLKVGPPFPIPGRISVVDVRRLDICGSVRG